METDQYLDLNGEQLIVGNLYFVELKNIWGIELQSERVVDYEDDLEQDLEDKMQEVYDLEKFQHSFYVRNVFEQDFQFPYNDGVHLVLLKYLGDNKFLEYSSKMIIRYQDYAQSYSPYLNAIAFIGRYNELIENPLFIKKGSLLKVTNENRKQFYSSNVEDTQVYLCAAKEDCVINLEEQLKRIVLQDEKFAYLEHEVWKFERSKLKN